MKGRAKKRSLAAMTSTSRRGSATGNPAAKMVAGLVADGRELSRMGKAIITNATKLQKMIAKAARTTATRGSGTTRRRRRAGVGGTTTGTGTQQRRAA